MKEKLGFTDLEFVYDLWKVTIGQLQVDKA